LSGTGKPRIRGYLGERSFEITEGFEHLEMIAEAMVFSSVYRTERKLGASGTTIPAARDAAFNATRAFQELRGETVRKKEA
jgi:hypothetical protein